MRADDNNVLCPRRICRQQPFPVAVVEDQPDERENRHDDEKPEHGLAFPQAFGNCHDQPPRLVTRERFGHQHAENAV
jgi:hypothetical protein